MLQIGGRAWLDILDGAEDPERDLYGGRLGELEVPTLTDRVLLKIPEGCQSGKLFRLRGKGVRSVRGGDIGDLVCKVLVETPVHLNRKQKELLREFERSLSESGKKHSPKAHSWLDGVMKFFEDMKP